MSIKKIITFLLVSFIFIINVHGQSTGDFRSKAAGPANWNDFNAWERYSGTAWVAATSGQLPTTTSSVEIQSGHSMIINATGLVSGNLTVNGSLSYLAATASALTVSGNVTVNSSGSFTSPASGTVVTHALNIGGSTATGIGGNLIVNGVFNMNVFPTAGVVVTFYGTPNNSISGSGSIINFYSLIVSKGTSSASILDITSVITCVDGNSTNGLRLNATVGTIKISSASVLSPYYGTITINSNNSRIWLNNSSAILKSAGAGTQSGATGFFSFMGTLQIDAGTVSFGNGSSTLQFINTLAIAGSSAVLNVYGSLWSGGASVYTMSSGSINVYSQVGTNKIGAGSSSFNYGSMFNFTGSSLTFSGGTLTLVDPNPNGGAYDYSVNITSSANFTGSTLCFGNGVSNLAGSALGYYVNASSSTFGNIIVNNDPSSILATRFVNIMSNITINNNLTINGGVANLFKLNTYALSIKGNITNAGTFVTNNVSTNGITFTGNTQQIVSNTGTFISNIPNLTINNTSGSTPAVDIQVPLTVSNSLTLTAGQLGSSNSSVLTFGNSAVSTALNLTRSGGSLASSPVFSLGGVTLNNVTYNAPSPAASIITGVELPASTPITLFTVNNASGVILDKPVSCTTLALTSGILTATLPNTITVTGTNVTNITGGSATAYVNGALTRILPNNAVAANYKFPIGKTAYRLFEFGGISTTGTGTASFTVEAFDAGPYTAVAGTGLSAINTDKYWSLTGNLGTVTISALSVRLTDAGLIATNRIGQSNSSLDVYNSIGGTVTGGTLIISTTAVDYSAFSTGTYFRIGSASAFASGNYAIGPQATYAGYTRTFQTFASAVNAITAVPLIGNMVFEFQSDYNPSVETYPISMSSTIATSASANVIFRPAAGVSSLINFTTGGNVITNAGADYVIIDGRNGGVGSNKYLQFTNTTTTGSAITLSTDATNNQLQYLVLKGSTTTATTGILLVNAPTSGNNFLTINNCSFDGSATANNCIYISGIATDATITNNNFFDYRNGAGVNLANGSNNSVIDNNSFYQTQVYNGFAGTTVGIIATGGNNCRISNNNIGGSGPALSGIWTVSATSPAAYNFTGISASLATTSKIYGNKIQNFDWKSNASTWTGMNVSGSVNVGSDGTNYIGNSTGNDNIKVTYFATGSAQINGIVTSGAANIENNVIGSIRSVLNSGITGTGCSFTGINSSGTGLINNNTIGSTTTALSINTAAQSVNSGTQNVYGFYSNGGTVNFTNNTIANISNGSIVASGITRGILLPNSATSVTITSNNIYSISTAQPVTGSGFTAASLDGINIQASNASTMQVTGNTIYDLVNSTPSAAVYVNGIYYNGSNYASNKFEKNNIHSFRTVSPSAVQIGLNINYGGFTFQNNIIRLGTDIYSNPVTNDIQINGILKASSQTCNFYFNTVLIGGSGVTASTVNTYAFNITTHSTEDVRNNIFVNSRSGGSKNYAIKIPGTTPNPTNLICNYNDLFVSGTGGNIGYYNSADQPAITDWRTVTGVDANSLNIDPQFTAVNNLQPLNALIAAGVPISGITTDFGGLTRNVTTPSIGAYEYLMPQNKTVNLTLFLEGLYAGGGTMNQAQNDIGNQFAGTTADQITVELHDPTTFSNLIYSISNVNLNTNGLATITVPSIYGASYYIAVKNRNSIEAITSTPISFSSSTINYNFTTSITQAYGSNLKMMEAGVYALFGGDANGDGAVDVLDLSLVQNNAVIFSSGYLPSDINGDGIVDIFDLSMLQNNSLMFVSAVTP